MSNLKVGHRARSRRSGSGLSCTGWSELPAPQATGPFTSPYNYSISGTCSISSNNTVSNNNNNNNNNNGIGHCDFGNEIESKPHLLQKTALLLVLSMAVLMSLFPVTARAFDDLNSAQNLIYNSAHLANTSAGQNLTYQYASKAGDEAPAADRVTLAVVLAHDDDKRDVTLEFLSGEQRMPFPDFTAFRGNPVIIAMLEHVAQRMGRETGGGVLYFRNRIRDALAADDVTVVNEEILWDGKPIQSTQLSFSPFLQDPYLTENPEYKHTGFVIRISDQVPGSVVSILAESKKGEHFYFMRSIVLQAAGA